MIEPVAAFTATIVDRVERWMLDRQNSRIARRQQRRADLLAKAGSPPNVPLERFLTDGHDPGTDAHADRVLQVELVLAQLDSSERVGDNLIRATWALALATVALVASTVVVALTS